MTFRCTKKLLAAMGVTAERITVPASPLTEWYGNLIVIERRKCLLFTEATTLFSFLVRDVRKDQLRDLGGLFRAHLAAALLNHGFVRQDVDRLTADATDVITTTSSKSILGTMNDHAFACCYHAEYEEGLARLDVADLNRRLNDTPLKGIGNRHALDVLREAVSGRRGN